MAINLIKMLSATLRWPIGAQFTMGAETLYGLGIALILAGMIVILAAILLFFLSNIRGKGKIKGGGVILIGPFQIVFGTDKESVKKILLLSLVLTILLIILMVIFYFVLRR